MVREEARNWFDGALVDLEEAKSALSNRRYNWALFAAHQAVEKVLKATFIVLRRKRPPKSHDLTRLLSELDIEISEDLRIGITELTPYYTIARYPNAGLERPWESISRTTAERLLRVAEEVVKYVGRLIGLG